MFPGDGRSRWPSGLLDDPRVISYWDQAKAAGRWYGQNGPAGAPGHIEWDAWFLYGPEAQWSAVPGPLLGRGRTIVATREKLKSAVDGLLR